MAEWPLEKVQWMHARIEDAMIDFRDSRIAELGPAQGMVVREYDGSPSSIIRMGTRTLLRMMNRLSDEYDADPPVDIGAWFEERQQRIAGVVS